MGAPKFINVVVVAGAVVLSGCSTAPETTRTVGVGLETQASVRGTGRMLSSLSAEFRREVPHVINFDFDSSILDDEAKRRLDSQAEWIGNNPGVRFAVTGHTDRVGNVAYNEALGLARAQAAVDYMVMRGVSETQLVAMISEGETDPVIKTEDREVDQHEWRGHARRKRRRHAGRQWRRHAGRQWRQHAGWQWRRHAGWQWWRFRRRWRARQARQRQPGQFRPRQWR